MGELAHSTRFNSETWSFGSAAFTVSEAQVNLLIASSVPGTRHYSKPRVARSIMNQRRVGVRDVVAEQGSNRIRYWDNKGINSQPFRSAASTRPFSPSIDLLPVPVNGAHEPQRTAARTKEAISG